MEKKKKLTREQQIEKLKKDGYNLQLFFDGRVIATKGNAKYNRISLNSLCNSIY